MSELERGLICQFKSKNWEMNSDISSLYKSNKSKNACLQCIPDTVHSKNEPNSWWLVNFSKPILVYSYSIYAYSLEQHTLSNWKLYQLDYTNEYIESDERNNTDIRGNRKKFAIQSTFKTNSIKLIGGKDQENDDNFIKFQQIEFYGKLFPLYDKYSCRDLYFHILNLNIYVLIFLIL